MYCAYKNRITIGLRRTLFSTFRTATTDTNANASDTLMQRIANMILTVTDRQPSKILHIYPEMRMNEFLSDHAIFEVVGLSELPEGNIGRTKQYEDDHYSTVLFSQEPFNPTLKTEIRPNSFHVVVCCAPNSSTSTSATSSSAATATTKVSQQQAARFGSALGVDELLRIVASGGHLVLGAPSLEFEQRGYLDELRRISETTNGSYNGKGNNGGNSSGNCVSSYSTPFRGSLLSIQQVAATHDSHAQDNASKNADGTGQYTIALFRKR